MTSSAPPPDSRISTLQARLAGLKAEIVQLHKENAQLRLRVRVPHQMEPALAATVKAATVRSERRATPESGGSWTAAEWARSLNLEKPISRSLVAKLRGGKPVNPQVFHRIVVALGSARLDDALGAVCVMDPCRIVADNIWRGVTLLHEQDQARTSRREAIEHPTAKHYHRNYAPHVSQFSSQRAYEEFETGDDASTRGRDAAASPMMVAAEEEEPSPDAFALLAGGGVEKMLAVTPSSPGEEPPQLVGDDGEVKPAASKRKAALAAVRSEHTRGPDANASFACAACGVRSTAARHEYWLVVDPSESRLAGRSISEWAALGGGPARRDVRPLADFAPRRRHVDEALREAGQPPLTTCEVIGARLLTGPMGVKYRRAAALAMSGRFDEVNEDPLLLGNKYATTLMEVHSALKKLAAIVGTAAVYRPVHSGKLVRAIDAKARDSRKSRRDRWHLMKANAKQVADEDGPIVLDTADEGCLGVDDFGTACFRQYEEAHLASRLQDPCTLVRIEWPASIDPDSLPEEEEQPQRKAPATSYEPPKPPPPPEPRLVPATAPADLAWLAQAPTYKDQPPQPCCYFPLLTSLHITLPPSTHADRAVIVLHLIARSLTARPPSRAPKPKPSSIPQPLPAPKPKPRNRAEAVAALSPPPKGAKAQEDVVKTSDDPELDTLRRLFVGTKWVWLGALREDWKGPLFYTSKAAGVCDTLCHFELLAGSTDDSGEGRLKLIWRDATLNARLDHGAHSTWRLRRSRPDEGSAGFVIECWQLAELRKLERLKLSGTALSSFRSLESAARGERRSKLGGKLPMAVDDEPPALEMPPVTDADMATHVAAAREALADSVWSWLPDGMQATGEVKLHAGGLLTSSWGTQGRWSVAIGPDGRPVVHAGGARYLYFDEEYKTFATSGMKGERGVYLTTSAPARVVARGRGGRISKPVPVAVPSWDVPVTGGPKLQPAAPTKDANDWVFALSDGDVEVAAALVCAHLHRSIAVADVADASRWCSTVTRLLMNENAEVPALASRSAQKNDVIGALLGAVRMPPQKKRSQVAHSQMQRAALEALSTFFTRPASSTCSQEARAMAAKLGGTRSVFIALNATADAPDPRSDPNEEDPRVTLTLAALAALDSLLGDRNPFGRAHNSILVGELQRVVELGGASLISTLAAIGIRDESVTYHALRLFESLSKKVLDLPAHVQHYAPARCDRLMSDGAVEQVLRSMSAHPKSLRSQVCGLRVIAAVCDGAETSSSSANRAELLVNDGAVSAILAAMAEHATSLDVALAGSWALFGLCVGDAAPARKRSRRAADEGALLALASVVQTFGLNLSNVREAACSALSAVVGRDQALRAKADAAGVPKEAYSKVI